MQVYRQELTANGTHRFTPKLSGRYNVRYFGTWGAGGMDITMNESEAGFALIAAKTANTKTEVTIERGRQVEFVVTKTDAASEVVIAVDLIEAFPAPSWVAEQGA